LKSSWITLNVGGTRFLTTKATLKKDSKSFLSRLASCDDINQLNEMGSDRDNDGAYLINRSPIFFEHILNYLRTNKLIYETRSQLQGIQLEAEFYNLQSLMKTCKEILNETQNHVTTCKNGTHTAYRVLMCSELDLTSTLASLSDGWKFEQVTSLKAVDEVRNNSSGNEFLLVLSRRSTLPESTLNLHQGKKIGKHFDMNQMTNDDANA
jgi:hypothetical protein